MEFLSSKVDNNQIVEADPFTTALQIDEEYMSIKLRSFVILNKFER